MRHMVKENLFKMDGTPLFPERRAETVPYRLSESEGRLYKAVTEYVREEFNRAEKLNKKHGGTVGFALTILQRRLTSSPDAICQSLSRRRDRLEKRLREEELLRRRALSSEAFDKTREDIEGLDRYEGVALDCYRKAWIDVASGSGEMVRALVYLSNRSLGHGNGRSGYMEKIVQAAKNQK